MNSTERFSDRVADYVRYRPSYPGAMIEHLRAAGILRAGTVVADVGSGTGLLAELFLREGNRVFGVEPNAEMRMAGEEFLRGYGNFTSVEGTAEGTGLAAGSVDLVTAGQAFHWFKREAARREFARILRPGGWVALIWNERQVKTSAFLAAYEALLHQYAADYQTVYHRHVTDEIIADFYAPQGMEIHSFANQQVFDLEGLTGRLFSSSYAPAAGDPRRGPMLEELRGIFEAHQEGGRVVFAYETKVYTGRL